MHGEQQKIAKKKKFLLLQQTSDLVCPFKNYLSTFSNYLYEVVVSKHNFYLSLQVIGYF